jgi:hypothetical protein
MPPDPSNQAGETLNLELNEDRVKVERSEASRVSNDTLRMFLKPGERLHHNKSLND